MKPYLLLIAIITLMSNKSFAQSVEVSITKGTIAGETDRGVQVFRGIPFAAPPVGDLRWKAPQAVDHWEGVLACTEFSPICPQASYAKSSIYYSPLSEMSEDCLYLNVWSQDILTKEKKPVMVWIHGGALTRGSGARKHYDGVNLAKKGVVVVTINYRLGAFGFLALDELSAESPDDVSGNYGILDQIAALKWVQENIHHFGGDSNKVTIFGESAGSWSVCALVATPMAKGLFHRAIGQSGSAFTNPLYLKEGGENSGEKIGARFMKACGAEDLKSFRQVPADSIVSVFFNTYAGRQFKTSVLVDGYYFPKSIQEIFSAGEQNNIPTMIGSNRDEMTAFTWPSTLPKTIEEFRKNINNLYGDMASIYFEAYPVLEPKDILRSHLDHGTDRIFGLGMRQWAQFTNEINQSAYLYQFTRIPQIKQKDYMGAYHAAEIAYVFNNLDKISSPDIYKDADYIMADQLSNYWVNFAKHGHPNSPELPVWLPYDPDNEYYQELDLNILSKQHLLKKRHDTLELLLQHRKESINEK